MEIFIVVLAGGIVALIIAAMVGNKRRAQEPPPPAVDDRGATLSCLRCNGPMVSLGVEPIRIGGTTGGWKLIFGEWAELGENMLQLEFMACPKCDHVELRLPARA